MSEEMQGPEETFAEIQQQKQRRQRIAWDDAAAVSIPGAPDNVALWEHCIDLGYAAAGAALGIPCGVIAREIRRPGRADKWPEELLPQTKTRPRTPRPKTYDTKKKREAAERAAALKKNPKDRTSDFPVFIPRVKLYKYMEDPVEWCKVKRPQIESKKRGRIPFVPWDFQQWIMRDVMKGDIHLYEKSRQVAVSTPIAVAFGHALLYQQVVTGKPFHGHVFANKEDKALMLAKKTRLAIWTATEDDPEVRACLTGCDPVTNVKKTFYRTKEADNHLLIHTTTHVDVRGDDVNAFLIDEAAFLANLEDVWASCVGATEPGDYGALVSTPAEETNEFAQMCDKAEEFGWHYMPVNWKANEERLYNRRGEFDDGKEWSDAKIKESGISLFSIEHELKRIGTGSTILDMNVLVEAAKNVKHFGTEPIPGHTYVKGLDIGGTGDLDEIVFVVIDVTSKPAQVVYEQSIEPKPKVGEKPQDSLKRQIEEFDRKWPGKTYADCTNNRAFVALLNLTLKHAIRLVGGSSDTLNWDPSASMRVRSKSRSEAQREWTICLETGALVAWESVTPKLWKSMKTMKQGNLITTGRNKGMLMRANKQKRLGSFADYWDAGMLARLGMGRVRDIPGHRGRSHDDEELEKEDTNRRRVQTLKQTGPGDKLRERVVVGGRVKWVQGERY